MDSKGLMIFPCAWNCGGHYYSLIKLRALWFHFMLEKFSSERALPKGGQ